MATLGGIELENASIEVTQTEDTLNITIKCDYLVTAQMAACSASCNDPLSTVNCTDGNQSYDGQCVQVCCLVNGATVRLTACINYMWS